MNKKTRFWCVFKVRKISSSNLGVKKISKKRIFNTRRFTVIDAKLKIRGKIINKPYISHNDCAEILAITKTGKVVLIKAYRPELNAYDYELPSGTLKNNEKPEIAARRELEEETGYNAKSIRYMFSGHPLLGYSDCKLYFFLATGLEKIEQKMEEDESILVREFTFREVFKMLKGGKIKDLCVLSAIHYYHYVMNKGKKNEVYLEP